MNDFPETAKSPAPRDERVAALAYLIWEQEGRPDGKHEEHWFVACKMIDADEEGLETEDLPAWLARAKAAEKPEAEKAPKAKPDNLMSHPRHRSAA